MHVARVTSVCWSPDSTLIASGGLDTNIVVAKVTNLDDSKVVVKGMNLNIVIYCTKENFGRGNFVNLANCELFAKSFLTNIHRHTKNVFDMH